MPSRLRAPSSLFLVAEITGRRELIAKGLCHHEPTLTSPSTNSASTASTRRSALSPQPGLTCTHKHKGIATSLACFKMRPRTPFERVGPKFCVVSTMLEMARKPCYQRPWATRTRLAHSYVALRSIQTGGRRCMSSIPCRAILRQR